MRATRQKTLAHTGMTNQHFLAERARFELAVSCPTLVFKTSTLNHSVTSPERLDNCITTLLLSHLLFVTIQQLACIYATALSKSVDFEREEV